MAEAADEVIAEKHKPTRKPSKQEDASFTSRLKKRWRAWLRAIHRDVGYLAIGFTVIYAVSGIAMNHIDDWDPNFVASERTLKITPIPDDASDAAAVALVAKAVGAADYGTPSDVYRAGDEVRLEYANGAKVTAIGDTAIVQARSSRFFFRVAVWLHATRGKQAWKYISDAYAVLLLYLAISGIFMIKGKLGLKWRGTILMTAGFALPIAYIVITGGPGAHKTDPTLVITPGSASPDGIRYLPTDEPDEPAAAADDGIRYLPTDEADEDNGVRYLPPDDDAVRPERPTVEPSSDSKMPVRKQPPPE